MRKLILFAIAILMLTLTACDQQTTGVKADDDTGTVDDTATDDGKIYHITVDYGRSIADMITAGKYDDKDPQINAYNFTVSGNGKVEIDIVLFHYNEDASTDAILVEMGKQGLRPATLFEALAFGEKYPDEQLKYPIPVLGSVWRNRFIVSLFALDSKRQLDLLWYENDWYAICRFITVRE